MEGAWRLVHNQSKRPERCFRLLKTAGSLFTPERRRARFSFPAHRGQRVVPGLTCLQCSCPVGGHGDVIYSLPPLGCSAQHTRDEAWT